MTFLNPRPAPSSLPYPWSYNGETVGHIVKLPIPLTYDELQEAQIVVTGVTDAINVIEGTVESNMLTFRAGGLVVAKVIPFEGANDLVTLEIDEGFTGEILAVSFDSAYKNLPKDPWLDKDSNNIMSWLDGENPFAKCLLNGVVIESVSNYTPSNGLLGSLVFQSQYIQNYGNVIESYYWTNGRYLYILRLNDSYKMVAINLESTESPLQYPVI